MNMGIGGMSVRRKRGIKRNRVKMMGIFMEYWLVNLMKNVDCFLSSDYYWSIHYCHWVLR